MASAEEVRDQSQTGVDPTLGNLVLGGQSDQVLAQTLLPGVAGSLTAVELPVWCPSGDDLQIEVQAVASDGTPSGVTLASHSEPGAALGGDQGTFHRIALSDPPVVDPDTPVAIVLYSTGTCSISQGPPGDSYFAGDGFYGVAGASVSWFDLGRDLPFVTWVDDGTTPSSPGADNQDLQAAVSVQYEAGLLSALQATILTAWTGVTRFSLRHGLVQGALYGLGGFDGTLYAAADAGTVTEATVASLTDQSQVVRDGVLTLSTVDAAPRYLCAPPSDADPLVLTVGPGQAFSTIDAAAAYAESEGAPRVEYRLAPGAYYASLEITRDTVVRGGAPDDPTVDRGDYLIDGQFVVRGPHVLELHDVDLFGSTARPLSTIEDPCLPAEPRGSAIWLDDQCAYAEVVSTDLSGGLYGVYQRRGGSRIVDSRIAGSLLSPFELGSGTGLLACSGDVAIIGTNIVDHPAAGVVVNGPNTVLRGTVMRIRRTGLNPALRPALFGPDPHLSVGIGALYVGGGASATVNFGQVTNNIGLGIIAEGDGTRLVYDNGAVLGVANIDCAPEEVGTICTEGQYELGIAFAATHGASASAEDFDIGHADFVGVLILDAEMDLRRGSVRNNTIGVNLDPPGYDLDRLTSGVRYTNNGLNFDARQMPVPDVNIDF